jgi:hypothetical protein
LIVCLATWRGYGFPVPIRAKALDEVERGRLTKALDKIESAEKEWAVLVRKLSIGAPAPGSWASRPRACCAGSRRSGSAPVVRDRSEQYRPGASSTVPGKARNAPTSPLALLHTQEVVGSNPAAPTT